MGEQRDSMLSNMEEERFVRNLLKEQDNRIFELESSQKRLILENKAQNEQIDSELALNKHEVEGLSAQINVLSRKGKIHDSELRELTKRFEETSRCSQLEHIAETDTKHAELVSEHALHTRKIERQIDRIAELESSQKRLDLEQKAQSDRLSLFQRDVTQRFEKACAELNVEFQNSHMWRAEVGEICRINNEWCSQLDELTERLETQIAEHHLKLNLHSSNLLNFETFRDQFESRLTLEHKICQELFQVGVKANASELQDLRDTCDVRIKDLTSLLDVEYAGCKEKQEVQNQVENSCRTLTTTLAEAKSSLIESESILHVLMGQSSDRESTERCRQFDDLESRVKAEIETCADILQEHETRLEESVWDLQQKSCPNVLESDDGVDGEGPKIFTTVHDLAVGFLRRRGFLQGHVW